MSTAVIVPVYLGAMPGIDKPEVEKFMGKLATSMDVGDTLYLMEDGKHPRLGFIDTAPHCLVHHETFGDHKGCTRGWEHGGALAFQEGHDVLIFSNQDANPKIKGDYDALVRACLEHPEYFAIGPVTSDGGAGHGPDEQKGTKATEGLHEVGHLNGFTFAVHRDNYERVVCDRVQGTFFLNEPLMRWNWIGRKAEPCDRYEQSLMWVGQEDELFDFATQRLGMPLAVCGDSFWRHDKWELTRKVEVEQ